MIPYLFKSTLCLAIFLLVYLLLLEKEKMHRFNRWYLLGSIVGSFVVPLISFKTEIQALPVLEEIQVRYIELINAGNIPTVQSSVAKPATSMDWQKIVLISYCIISIGLLIRFSRNIYLLLSRIAKNKVIRYGSAKLVLLKENVVSHTFLDHIFISETDYTNQKLEQEILIHELTHVRQKHSLDILFIELLQAVCWFNPLFIFYKKAIQLNHEFLADDAVIKNSTNVQAYQYLLLEKGCLGNNALLSSPFNFSVTKKRLVMMTTTANSKRILAKQAAVVPLLGILLFLFASKTIIAQNNSKRENDNKAPTVTNEAQKNDNPFLRENFPQTKEGVSKAEFDEYFAIEQKYFDLLPNGYKNFPLNRVSEEDRKRLESIFLRMNREQQMKCHVIFLPPLTPTKSEPPTQIQLDAWKNGDVYGVWIGDRKIKNEELNNYNPSDFSWYNASKLYPNARKNVKYKVQVTLFTNEEFRKMNEFRKKDKRNMIAVYWPDRNRQS